MVLLSHQSTIYKESQPGGYLNPNFRYAIPPEGMNFTLAAMVLCLYLQYRTKAKRKDLLYADTKDQMLFQALNTSHAIWQHLSNEHHEAGKVANVLDKIMGQLRPRLSFPDDRLLALEPGVPFSCGESSHIGGQSTTRSESSLNLNIDCTESGGIEMSDFNWVRISTLGRMEMATNMHFHQDVWDSFVQGDSFETAYLSLLGQELSSRAGVRFDPDISPSTEWFTHPCATSEPWDQQPEPMLRPQLGASPPQHISGSSRPSP